MKLYKITDKDSRTRGVCQWGENVTHKATTKGNELCTDQVIHAYTDPYLAVLFNPIGGGYDPKTMLLWEAKGRIVATNVDKVGCKSLTTIKQIDKPHFTIEQLVTIAIKCAMEIYPEKSFTKWAEDWLNGKDRTIMSARAAAAATEAARAARAARAAAVWVAEAAAEAARAGGKKSDLLKIITEVLALTVPNSQAK